jgi:nicotinate-nucleotide pyrophosphorylase
MIDWSLKEDLGECDHTSASSLPEGLQREGWILAKEDGVVAGLGGRLPRFSVGVSPDLDH